MMNDLRKMALDNDTLTSNIVIFFFLLILLLLKSKFSI